MHWSSSAQILRFAQDDGHAYGVDYCDRTVPMSEAARRAVEKVAR
jgi:hypothetical protein